MVRQIFIPVVLQPRMRSLWSENGQPNGIVYTYCASHCLSANVHCGHDVEAIFEPVFAATDGVVKFGGRDTVYTPCHVDIEPIVGPFRGEYHIYAHMSEAWVATGQMVRKGQQIGISGTNCVDSQCSALANGNEHLHWERRAGFDGCSLDPDPVLTSQDANGGASPNGSSPAGAFGRRDLISVAEGPLRLRQGPGSGFAILHELPLGARMCVGGEPQSAEGHTWYPVLIPNINQPGWVAGAFCALVVADACGAQERAPAIPENAAAPGQPIGAHPDSGPAASMPESAAAMPMVEYDADGAFVGVTFPTPPPSESAPANSREFSPYARG